MSTSTANASADGSSFSFSLSCRLTDSACSLYECDAPEGFEGDLWYVLRLWS